jgi:hypothetical protein
MPAFVTGAVVAGVFAGTTFTVAAGLTIGFSWGAFGAALVMGAISRAMMPKPKAPGIERAGQLVTVRQPIAPWQVIYGEARVGGVITFLELGDYTRPPEQIGGQPEVEENAVLHLVVTFACHPCEEIVSIYFDEYELQLTPESALFTGGSDDVLIETGRFNQGNVIVEKSLGTEGAGVQPFPRLQAYSAQWLEQHAQTGRCKVHLELVIGADDRDLFPTGIPNISALIKGVRDVRDPRTGATGWTSNAALCRAHYLASADFGIGADFDEELDEDQLVAAANESDEEMVLGQLAVSGTVTADADTDSLPFTGFNLRQPRTGDGLRFSSTGALPGGISAGTTYYAIRTEGGVKLATSLANARAGTAIDITSAGSGTHTATCYSEPRYTVNGAFTVDAAPEDVLVHMEAATAGITPHVGATWHVLVGGYEAPTLELTEEDLAGPVTIQGLVSRRESCNAVRARLMSPADGFQPIDAPLLESATYLEEDNGERVERVLDLTQFVTSSAQAQRLQKIELLRTRQALTVSAPFKLKALRARAGKPIALTIAKYGWTSKPFEVVGFTFEVAKGEGDGAPRLVVGLSLRETAAEVYDWNSSEEQAQDPAPNSNLPDPFTVQPPGAPTVTETQYETRAGGGTKSKAVIAWTGAADPYVALYVLRYKVASADDATYIEMAPRRSLSAELLDLEPERYTFGVKSLNFFGVSSAWSEATVNILGLTAAPADLTGLSIQAAGGLAILRWDLHPDLFVREGGFIEFRHTEVTNPALAVWEESFSIGERVSGNTNQAALPLKPGAYLAKAVAQNGQRSATAAVITTKQASVLNYVDVDLLQEDSTFPGTHDNTVAVDGVLKLAGIALFDAIADVDAVANLDSYGGLESAGTYSFQANLDLGAVDRVRLTSQLEGLVTNLNDKLDERAALIDEWEDFDGNAGAVADAYLEVRETDDDPASSPAWSDWKRLDAAEFNARGFEFRARLLTADDSYNVLIETLRVRVAQLY